MEHDGHHPSWSTRTPEHQPNGNTANSYSDALRLPHPNGPPPYHAQPPPPTQQYPQPVTPYAHTPYTNDYNATQQIRRKQVRATQACNHCRLRKQKCDEARPCQFCRENNFDCQYKDVPPPKKYQDMTQLQGSVDNISHTLSHFVNQFDTLKQGVESKMPPTISNHASPEASFSAPQRDPSASRWPTPIQGKGGIARVNSLKMESPVVAHSGTLSPLDTHASAPIKQQSQFAPPAESALTDRGHATETGLQGDHTAPAHKLLEEWTQMNIFYQGIPRLEQLINNGYKVSDYPMQLEQDRGTLRVWGVGEGHDDNVREPGSPGSSNDSNAASPAPGKDGLWGHPPYDHQSPFEPSSTPRENYQGGLGPDGLPDFRRHVMFELLKSYMDSMHMFHPFINEVMLKRMFREFSDQYSPESRDAGTKRKRSIREEIERSMSNAIVLLVLALGKVCSYTDPLPAPQNDRNPYIHSEYGYIRNSPNANGSFAGETSEDSRPRNIDILPGMAYYAYATDILGNQQGGNTTVHAQAMLLAGLYLGQFARVLESWSWINNACRIALVLIKADYSKLLDTNNEKRKFWSPKERYRLNQIILVYWTALQLQSDILAEMSNLPSSGITAYQSDIMYPEVVHQTWLQQDDNSAQPEDKTSTARNDLMMKLHSSQIFLRKTINTAQDKLYGSSERMSFDPTDFKEVAKHARRHVNGLENWRNLLSPELAWSDDNHQSTDLNIARMRAKYYGGLYMMLRPYLKVASDVLQFPPSPPGNAGTSQYNLLSKDQQEVIDIALKCIHSAIYSTIAFDHVGKEPGSRYEYFTPTRKNRLVVTNIFGTLHAQFGNILVLAAVYKSKLYYFLPASTLLTEATLSALLKRTIDVIEDVAPNSPILRMNLEILRNIQRQQGL